MISLWFLFIEVVLLVCIWFNELLIWVNLLNNWFVLFGRLLDWFGLRVVVGVAWFGILVFGFSFIQGLIVVVLLWCLWVCFCNIIVCVVWCFILTLGCLFAHDFVVCFVFIRFIDLVWLCLFVLIVYFGWFSVVCLWFDGGL